MKSGRRFFGHHAAPTDQFGPLIRKAFHGPLSVCGGFHRSSAWQALAEGRSDLVAFGAGFIANPDLVERLRRNAAWNPPDPSTFYTGGDRGYTDYPVLDAAASAE